MKTPTIFDLPRPRFFDAIRRDMYIELRDNAKWYHDITNVDADGQPVEVENWAIEWEKILNDAKPTGGKRVPPESYLTPRHILA